MTRAFDLVPEHRLAEDRDGLHATGATLRRELIALGLLVPRDVARRREGEGRACLTIAGPSRHVKRATTGAELDDVEEWQRLHYGPEGAGPGFRARRGKR